MSGESDENFEGWRKFPPTIFSPDILSPDQNFVVITNLKFWSEESDENASLSDEILPRRKKKTRWNKARHFFPDKVSRYAYD